MTTAQALAIAVLKGDLGAAYALADRLQEEANDNQELNAIREAATRGGGTAYDGHAVYHWPEFQAFAQRLGLMWNLRTIDVSIHIREGELVTIEHRYAGSDVPADQAEVEARRRAGPGGQS